MPCSNTTKGICCVISSIMIFLILGNVYTWANINVYYVSYVRLTNPTFTLIDGFFMVPACQIFNNYTVLISGIIEKRTGPRLFNILCCLFVVIAHILLYFYTNYWIIMIAMCICGCGFGVGYFPMLKTSWQYFPKKKGLISGIVICCIGFCTLIFTSIADYMINPEGKPTVGDYFEYEIAIRTKNFILVMIIVISCLGVISNCLVFPYQEEKSSEVIQESIPKEELNNALIQTEITNPVYVQKERVKEVLRIKEFYLLGIMGIGVNCKQYTILIQFNLVVGSLITSTNRTFGTINRIDETLLQTLSKVFALLNGSTRILWGIIFDKVSFTILYSIILVNYLFCSFGYYYSGQNGIAYFIVNCFVCLSFSGQNTIFNPTIIYYFGVKNSAIIAGMYNLLNGVTVLINPILCKFVVNQKEDYLIVYLIGGSFSLIAAVCFFVMKKQAYVYTWKSKTEEEQIRQSQINNDERISKVSKLFSNSL